MKSDRNASQNPGERLDPKVVSNLAKLGWTVPQTPAEVRAAEEHVAKTPMQLPARLSDSPEAGRAPERGGILDRYLRSEGRESESNERATDEGRDRDLDRE